MKKAAVASAIALILVATTSASAAPREREPRQRGSIVQFLKKLFVGGGISTTDDEFIPTPPIPGPKP